MKQAEIVCFDEALQTTDYPIVPLHPFRKKELANNPELKDRYYSVGNRLWIKKVYK